MAVTFDKLLGKALLHSHKAGDLSDFIEMDTKENILSKTPSTPKLGFATDTNEFYLFDGSDWKVASLELKTENQNPDIGKEQESDKLGYGSDYITNKSLNYVKLGSGAEDEEGAIRLIGGIFQIYTNGVWNDVVINFVLREDEEGNYEFEHAPIGFDWYYEIMSGNSNRTGIEGKPLIQQYKTSMGAYQPDVIIDGGE